MKNKLFLSLSLLTMAFSAQATTSLTVFNPVNQPASDLYSKLVRMAPEAAIRAAYLCEKAKEATVISAKTVFTSPRVIYAGKTAAFAGILGYLYNQYSKDQAQAAQVAQATEAAEAARIAGLSKFDSVKAALSNAGSSVKASVKGHPYASTGAGLATVAGLSCLAYAKFGKATKVVVTPIEKKSTGVNQPAVRNASELRK